MPNISKSELLACVVGAFVGGAMAFSVISTTSPEHYSTHPIADPFDSEYHVHADFHIYIQDELLDLSSDEFMTTSQKKHSEEVHLHDNNGEVEHIHAEDVTFASFLNSITINLSEDCLTTTDGNEYCANESNVLRLFVNGNTVDKKTEYIPVDDDRILLYYGNPDNPKLQEYLDNVPNDSCYYSGTCPERGTAPPESCGLTCEL